jgi:hypothetical protein
MVTTNEGAPSSSDPGSESGTALSKLRQTLSSSLMTAQDKGKPVCSELRAALSETCMVCNYSCRFPCFVAIFYFHLLGIFLFSFHSFDFFLSCYFSRRAKDSLGLSAIM